MTSSSTPTSGDSNLFDARELRQEVERVVSSPVFRDAERLQRFLKFVAEESLAGRGSRLKESVIGVEVFGRGPDYDPKIDPVVRVQARRLRSKLDLYYQSRGAENGICISIPKGGYAPLFVSAQPPALTSQPVRTNFIAEAATMLAPSAIPATRQRRGGMVVFGIAMAILLTAAGLLTRRTNHDTFPPSRRFTTYAGYQTTPAFSPDGLTIAFAWDGLVRGTSNIYVQRLDADSPRRLTNSSAAESRPVWLPDGQHLSFLRSVAPNRVAVVEIPLLGNGERTIALLELETTASPRLDWSHDGKYLYTSEQSAPGAPLHLVEIQADSATRRTLIRGQSASAGDDEATLSPDGKWLAFRRKFESSIDDVFLLPLRGGPLRALTRDRSGVIGMAWTRDSRALIVSSRRKSSLQSLWRFPLEGGDPIVLTDAAVAASYPVVNPRDGSIAYASRFLDANIWRINLQNQTQERLIESNLLDSCPHYSPDGQRIAFRSNRSGNDELWLANADGQAPVRLSHFGGPITGNGRWSPNGQLIAVDSRPNGSADVFLLSTGGGAPQRMTREKSNAVLPSFSHDGLSLYFASDRSGQWQIWKQPVGGGNPQQVTFQGGFAPLESEDGQWLYYAKSSENGLFRAPVAGGNEERIVDSLPPSLWGGWAIAGDNLLYLSLSQDRNKAAQLMLFSLQTRQTRLAATLSFPPVLWDGALGISPDGKYALIAEVERSGSEIHLQPDR